VGVAALLPRIALPDRETRAAFVVAVRAATPRDAFAVVRVAVRVATPRAEFTDAAVPRDAFVVARDATGVVTAVRVAVVRADTVRGDATTFDAPVPRETVVAVVPRGLARPVRVAPAADDCGTAIIISFAGAIGSANTARIDTKVEQTKNAPASKNTVPIAFLHKSATLRLFINFLPMGRKGPKPSLFMVKAHRAPPYTLCNYNIFDGGCK